MTDAPPPPNQARDLLVVEVVTDDGATGIGLLPEDDASWLRLVILDVVAPRCLGEDSRQHERLSGAIDTLENPVARRAYSAIDLALWDLKGKRANEPLWRLWGGSRDSARLFFDETADPQLSSEAVVQRGRAALAQGFQGLRVSTSGANPEAESHRLVEIRDALGDDFWLAVSVQKSYDYETALPMTRFLDEEIGADWLEDPLPDDDLAGYRLLTAKTETALALGRRFNSPACFRTLLEAGVPFTLRPSLPACGGITGVLKLAALAELHRRSIVPHLPTEIAIHLACGLPNVPIIGYDSRWAPLFVHPLAPKDGRLAPPPGPGLGVELNRQALERFTVAGESRQVESTG